MPDMWKLERPAKPTQALAEWFYKMTKDIFKIGRRSLLRQLFAGSAIATLLETQALAQNQKSLRFLVIGDWGRYGTPQQKMVAQAMADTATEKPCDFIISVGDNFYNAGVKSIDDPHWQKSFEDVYNAPSLQKNWYVALGNHDYGGNPQAQVEYSQISKHWKMPSRYYKIPTYAPDIDIFVIDTTPIVWKNDNPSPEQIAKIANQDVEGQLNWLDTELAASNAKTKLVIGHHTIFSGGSVHGDGKEMIARVLPILKKHNVKAYINGHDHDLQYIVRDGFTAITSGSGSEARKVEAVAGTKFCKSELGFLIVEINAQEMKIEFRNSNNKTLYSEVV